jgi:hypothetical protein
MHITHVGKRVNLFVGIPCSQFVQEFKRRMLPDYWRAHVFVEAPKYVVRRGQLAVQMRDFYEISHAKGKEAEWVVNVSSYRVVSFNEVC